MSRPIVIRLKRLPRFFRDGKPMQVELQWEWWNLRRIDGFTHYRSGVGDRPYRDRSYCHGRWGREHYKTTTRLDRVTCPECLHNLAAEAARQHERDRRAERRTKVEGAA